VVHGSLPTSIKARTIKSFSIENQDVAIVSCTDGHSYAYDISMACWYRITDEFFMLSDFVSSLQTESNTGLLGCLQNRMQHINTNGSSYAQTLFKLDPFSQHAHTIAHLEVRWINDALSVRIDADSFVLESTMFRIGSQISERISTLAENLCSSSK
jgi:hypothetical protein